MSGIKLEISGKRKYIKSLIKEIKKEGFEFDAKISSVNKNHLCLWYILKIIDVFAGYSRTHNLQAQLPTHRKHFKREVRKTLTKKEKEL